MTIPNLLRAGLLTLTLLTVNAPSGFAAPLGSALSTIAETPQIENVSYYSYGYRDCYRPYYRGYKSDYYSSYYYRPRRYYNYDYGYRDYNRSYYPEYRRRHYYGGGYGGYGY